MDNMDRKNSFKTKEKFDLHSNMFAGSSVTHSVI